jgi:hypothetical protein
VFDGIFIVEVFESFLKEKVQAEATCFSVQLVKKCVYLNPNIVVS